MKKSFLIIVALILVAVIGYFICQKASQPENSNTEEPGNEVLSFDMLNATYTIDGKQYTLVNGKAETEAVPGSAEKIVTMKWSDPVYGDISRDDVDDGAMIITQNSGGSGTFYYAVAAIKDSETKKAIGTNAILLGDRIAPQNISIDDGVILVNYAERLPGEPFSVQPSVGVSKWAVYLNGELKEMHICTAFEKIAKFCTKEYNPVCGDDLETYGNGCEACISNSANSWISGECQ